MGMWEQIGNEIASLEAGIRELPLAPGIAAVRERLEARFSFAAPMNAGEVVDEVMLLMRGGIVHVTHPRYFGLFNPSVRPIAVAAETVRALYNPQLAAWSHAPAINELERHTLHHLMAFLGWNPHGAAANFTTGGAEANLTAVLAALAHSFPEYAEQGVAALARRPLVYLTSESHHSFTKIARATGLGTSSLRVVPTTARGTFDPAALARAVASDRAAGNHPLLVVGTAGTTGAGLIDPLPALAGIARREAMWFHVDAAWGGSALLSPRLRPLLAGIEQADSVTWDAHKWLSVPLGAGMFFCRHPQTLARAFAATTSYMPSSGGAEETDPFVTTIQWSRRAIGLALFMALAELGDGGYASLIEHQADMGELLRALLRGSGWIVLNDTALPVVCFSSAAIERGAYSTRDLLVELAARNRVWISDVVLADGRRACITSYRTEREDLQVLIDELDAARRVAAGRAREAAR